VSDATTSLERLRVEYDRWYRDTYCPALRRFQADRECAPKPTYLSFPEWLIDRGHATAATERDVEVYER
jgi:hypothetical protein